MRATDRRFGWRVLLATVALAISGCGLSGRTVEQRIADGSAFADIRQQVDGRPQCLPLIGGDWPIEFSGDMLRRDSVDALVAAGLFMREPARTDRPDGTLRLVPTPLGKRHLRLVRAAGRALLQLLAARGNRRAALRLTPAPFASADRGPT